MPRIVADPVPLGDVRARLGERPVWDGATRTLLWVDVESGLVHRWPDGDPARALAPYAAGSQVGIAWPTASGGVLVAAAAGLRTLTGPVPHPPVLPAGRRWNDGATDPAGRLWLADMPIADATAPGAVHRLTPESCEVVLTGVTCGNGIQFSPDGRWMYLTDTVRRVLYRLPYDLASGTPGTPEPWFALTPDDPMPDGTTVDADGSLWVAVWGTGTVLRIDPTGRPVDAMRMPVPLTTCLGIGPDRVGWVTTAGSPDPHLGEPGPADGAGSVWRVRLPDEVRGVPVVPVAGV
nr:SMP-30/gluconolactonase/LRE family protein [Cellulomonas sp. RIT-PI-Y]